MSFKTVSYFYSKGVPEQPLRLFYKPHRIQRDKKNRNALFLPDILPFFNDSLLRKIFCKLGRITEVFIHYSPKIEYWERIQLGYGDHPFGGKRFAYIQFHESVDVDSAFRSNEFREPLILKDLYPELKTGYSLWVLYQEHQQLNSDKVLKKAQEVLRQYDIRKMNEKEKAKEIDVDEDGFILVKSKSFTGSNRTGRRKRSKKKTKDHAGMYRFKLRESKMEKISELRKRFEENRRRVAEMKANRSFNPFKS